MVLDIGISSMQIDDAGRGFSFRGDGPLDMRMDCEGTSAADLVNAAGETTLANIFYYFGEERASRRIAHAIVMDRAKAPFTSTAALASLIARVAPGRPNEVHPATRVFQALRIAVNDELAELVHALVAAEAILKQGGRLAVVTFHSLEDRIVKQFFAERSGRGRTPSRRLPHEIEPPEPTFLLNGKQPVTPSPSEIDANPRARSAKLRHGVRTKALPREMCIRDSTHIDEALMQEMVEIKAASHPHEILLVADSLTGQDAVHLAKSFDDRVGITGIVLTRIDGDGRGGAALSMRAVTGKPIKLCLLYTSSRCRKTQA